jgi:hypothetical protein
MSARLRAYVERATREIPKNGLFRRFDGALDAQADAR